MHKYKYGSNTLGLVDEPTDYKTTEIQSDKYYQNTSLTEN